MGTKPAVSGDGISTQLGNHLLSQLKKNVSRVVSYTKFLLIRPASLKLRRQECNGRLGTHSYF
jgi:hypothetical protein